MQVVIDISEKDYQTLKKKDRFDTMYLNYYEKLIVYGTPIPKGHGRLMILSEDKLKEYQINLDASCQKWISEVGLSNTTVTIIEADREVKDDNNKV